MTELARKILDQLMGADRNKLPSERHSRTIPYSHPDVCRYYLVDFCPHLQFMNTKSDIGACPKKWHEPGMREIFAKEASEADKEAFERQFMEYLEGLVADLEKKLRRGKDRLDVRVNDPSVGPNPEADALEERRTLLDLEIRESLKRIEQLAEEGEITEAHELGLKVEALRQEVEKLKIQEAENPMYRLEKRMELCQTCGAFLIVGDAPKRIESHYEGKQHNGWARVRQALDDYRKKYKKNTTYPHRREHERGAGFGSRHDAPSRDRNFSQYPPVPYNNNAYGGGHAQHTHTHLQQPYYPPSYNNGAGRSRDYRPTPRY